MAEGVLCLTLMHMQVERLSHRLASFFYASDSFPVTHSAHSSAHRAHIPEGERKGGFKSLVKKLRQLRSKHICQMMQTRQCATAICASQDRD